MASNWYETYQTAFGPKKGCMGKYDRCNDHKIYGKLSVDDTVETPVTSTCLSVDFIELETYGMSNKFLHTKSISRYILHMSVKLEYYYIGKGS
jgi:hypothetical protein